nr:hypothetical protein [Tanacetum cinerariifolium]
MQTQTSNTLHNAIMEAGSKDHSPMLAPGNYIQWKSRIKRYIDTKPNHELIHHCLKNPPYKFTWADKEVPISEGSPVIRNESYMETYKTVSQDIHDQLNAEAEAVQIILTGIDNDIYSTVDAFECIGKAIVNSPQPTYDQEPSMADEDDETSKDKEIDKLMALISLSFKKIYKPTNNNLRTSSNTSRANQDNSLRINRSTGGKAIVNSPQPTYDQEPSMADEDDETSKDKEIDKLMALISLSFKKIYKPTNNNLRTSSNTSRANQDNSPRINRSTGYEHQRIGNVVGARETVDKEVPISEGSPVIRNESYMETYKTVSQDIHDQLNAEAEVVQIILTGIDNDIYSTVDACPNA